MTPTKSIGGNQKTKGPIKRGKEVGKDYLHGKDLERDIPTGQDSTKIKQL